MTGLLSTAGAKPVEPTAGRSATTTATTERPDDDLRPRAEAALARAREHLLSRQQPEGWWQGELETNVTMEAEDLLMRQFLGILTPAETDPTARWIRSRQHPDGGWATFYDGPSDLSTTIEAYAALRLAGDGVDAEHMVRARDFVLANGGIERSRVFTRIWLALFGEWSWHRLPAIPPEVVLLPSWMPLNVYDFACWARQTIVPLAIVRAQRPVRPLGFSLTELRTGARPPRAPSLRGRAGWLHGLDAALRGYERRPIGLLRRNALRRAAEWVVARQEADGSWGGIQPPWVYSLLALHLLGYPLDHPVLRTGLAGLDRFTVREETPDGPVRRLEACQSPVWDTALAVVALADAGLPAEHPALVRAGRWLIDEEIRVTGDWAVRRPGLAPSGWAFEFDNDGYPDTDDTAEVLLALRRTAPGPQVGAALERGLRWLCGMQSRDGGWGAFDADNTRTLARSLPFCDFGEVIDPPSADVTAHIVEALCAEGMVRSTAVLRGVDWLLRAQEPDGSWFGRWGANHVYGTGAVVPALVAAGMRPDDPVIVRAVQWLHRQQNRDGGWGEDLRSYRDQYWLGRGASTASQTAWALLALHAAGVGDSAAAWRGVHWLVQTQRPDGSWDEPHYTGTGFPGDFYINYHLYRLVFPVTALGRLLDAAGTRDASTDVVAGTRSTEANIGIPSAGGDIVGIPSAGGAVGVLPTGGGAGS
ncbi:squalene--hopene cyclase [Micromonospora polyrhachis]|uniref:Squalene-hopene/tetraprenyl-beta-curcumene cyclase n=1 Tax=Micromonospora polyrhachis TaxID=1282883 RepID=A0A7W7SXA0_9ACTN|nr:squalene--hopene cyclase [Micromonospora polyrhachis]MBB4962631.1 squalene-hopene/tetraprenyl-beta-curcumene cyclase [Micromonospora polyrhachis]